jgi:ATP-binding cassette, subfamily B, bacterial
MSSMQLLWQEVRKYKKLLVGALFLAAVNQIFSLMGPQIFRYQVDKYASRVGELTRDDFIYGVLLLILLSMAVTFVSRVAKAFQDYYTNVIIQRSGTNLYAQSVSHAFSLPYAVFEDQQSGEILSKLQKARTDSQALIGHSINIFFFSLVGIVFVIIYASTLHWVIGLMFFLTIPVMGSVMFFLSKKIKEAQQAIVKATAALSGSTTETLRNVELVKSLGLENQEITRLNEVNNKILGLELNKVKMVRRLDFVQGTLVNTIASSLMFVLFLFIWKGTISLGEFMSLWIYTFFVFEPLRMFGMLATSYQEAKASLAQLGEILNIKPAPVAKDAAVLENIKNISYKDVSLSYTGSQKDAVSSVNMEINAGETVAFVGPSGSGKSSMIKLLAGLYSPTDGSLHFNDIDVSKIDINELRRRIGLVAQETQLFAGTVRENLLFVRPTATDAECAEALELAQAKTILDKAGTGLDTRIGEGGIKLSGGERQRLAIARALLRNPDLIVFDEATSSLDSITEKAITDTIKQIGEKNKDQIKVLVAHRLSTVAHADRIYVFEQGKITETGTHSELVSKGGLYAALWREQIAEDK